ncbi:hypothetical protein BC939DRAFT_131353 [Gamsiella multidivaricata]|uniref:uncharacterized protein n=1 Tax=Gamsiella multidivaricata TaxID=101098 RepID=UPI00221FFB15|nr:uncharacterized protein BC939DRAFT_131353 [Gamsiella multidivaricata]KAG0362909.1 hypothetical protein BGZ54_008432 [Gamsiella multidivaricata]KAI7825150.1 hypothetical protein BC939DRAFT_131353 [Gamsiella multidivaricata]
MMEPELMQQLRVENPLEEPELRLDGLQIPSIQVLLEPPAPQANESDDEDDGSYSPLQEFQNLVTLTMSNAQCQSLEGFPNLPLLRSLMLADNDLSGGFEALAEADLQNLVRLDLSGNKISNMNVLQPLDALENLAHILLVDNEIAKADNYRDAVFEILPQLITIDGLDRDGTELDVDDDDIGEAISGDEEEDQYAEGEVEGEDEGEYQIDDAEVGQDEDEDEDEEFDEEAQEGRPSRDDESEDIGSEDENDEEEERDEDIESNSDSELEDQENRRPMVGGKTAGDSQQIDDDEEDDDELEDEEDDENARQQHHQEVGSGSDEEEEEEDDDDEEEDEDEEEEYDDPDDGEEEGPGLAYLLTDDIPDDNDEEFEPGNEAEEESEIESSDEEEFGSSSAHATSRSSAATSTSSNTNGHPTKRPRSPTETGASGDFDHGQAAAGFDVDGDDTTNGFGMGSFDGPATFDDETTHEAKRPRT